MHLGTDAVAIIGFVALFALMLLRVPVGMAMGLVGVSGFGYIVGVPVADSVFDALRQAADPGTAGRELSLEIVGWLRSRVQGVQITSLHGSTASALALITALRRGGQPERHPR